MGRKMNTEERERISKVAFELFSKNGYDKTLISEIASKCGVEKSVVQYYFPKKEIFINSLLKKNFEVITKIIDNDEYDEYIRLYRIGYMHFDFLLNNKTMNLITRDIIADRALTANAILTEVEWASEFFGMDESFLETSNNITAAMGAAYELIYKYMKLGIPLSTQYLVEKTYLIFTICQGEERQKALNELEKFRVSKQWVDETASKINDLMFN